MFRDQHFYEQDVEVSMHVVREVRFGHVSSSVEAAVCGCVFVDIVHDVVAGEPSKEVTA